MSLPTTTSFKRFWAIAASLLAGILLAITIQLNATLGEKIGVLESTFIVHLFGSGLALLIILPGIKKERVKKMVGLPKHLFMGGMLGVFITSVGNIVVPSLGLLLFMSLLTTFDLVFSTAVDHIGLLGLKKIRITVKRTAGLFLASIGVILIFWG